MALWGSSRQSDLQSQIEEIQNGLAALGSLIGGTASQAGKSAMRGAHDAGEHVSDKASDMVSALGPLLGDIRSHIDNLSDAAGALTSNAAKRTAEEGKLAYRAVETKVSDNPMLAVAAAAGVGFLIGSLLLGSAAARRTMANAASAAAPKPQAQPRASARTTARGKTRKSRAA